MTISKTRAELSAVAALLAVMLGGFYYQGTRLDEFGRRQDASVNGLEQRFDIRVDGLEQRFDARVDDLDPIVAGFSASKLSWG